MTKPNIPLDKFIKDNLSQNCLVMMNHLNANNQQILTEASSYLEYQREYSVPQIISLKIKLFEYYSCMRQFDVAHMIQSEIKNLLVDCKPKLINGFENIVYEAEYCMLQGIQHRNYSAVQDFEKSEQYFISCEGFYENLINEPGRVDNQQYYIDEHFRSLMNRLGLYVNYDHQPEKAKQLISTMEKLLETTTVRCAGYLSIYHYCVGSYYLNSQDPLKAVDLLTKATTEIKTEKSGSWVDSYKMQLAEQLEKAKKQCSLIIVQDKNQSPNSFFQSNQETCNELSGDRTTCTP